MDLEELAGKLGQVTDENVKDQLLSRQAAVSKSLLDKLRNIDMQPSQAKEGGIAEAVELDKTAALEARLAALETLVGDANDGNSDLPPQALVDGLFGAVVRMDAQLQLLAQPRQLEQAVKRVKLLVAEMDRMERTKSQALHSQLSAPTVTGGIGFRPEVEAKIDRLFTTLDRLDPVLPVVPGLLERLRGLKALHERAATFSDVIQHVQKEQERLDGHVENVKTQSATLEQSFKENQDMIQHNIDSLQERINSLIQRMDKLKQ
jgi:hypothetical protein